MPAGAPIWSRRWRRRRSQIEEAVTAASEAASQAAASAAALGWQEGEVARLEAERARQQQRGVGLKNLRRLMRQADDSRAALDARATEVALTLEPEALARVQIGGRPAERSKQTLRAVDPIEIRVEGIGRIDIRPRVAQAERWRRDLADALHQIAGLLQELGLAPSGEAPERSGQLSLFGPRTDRPPDPAALEGLLAETERQGEALDRADRGGPRRGVAAGREPPSPGVRGDAGQRAGRGGAEAAGAAATDTGRGRDTGLAGRAWRSGGGRAPGAGTGGRRGGPPRRRAIRPRRSPRSRAASASSSRRSSSAARASSSCAAASRASRRGCGCMPARALPSDSTARAAAMPR